MHFPSLGFDQLKNLHSREAVASLEKYSLDNELERKVKLPMSLTCEQELVNIVNEMLCNVENYFSRYNPKKRQSRMKAIHPDQQPVLLNQ